jgi:hypothetical protein
MQKQSALAVPAVAMAGEAPAGPGYLRRVWNHWKHVAHAVGVVQTRFFMLLIYGFVVVPTGMLMRLSRDPLHLRKPEHGNWTPARQNERDLEAARRQF